MNRFTKQFIFILINIVHVFKLNKVTIKFRYMRDLYCSNRLAKKIVNNKINIFVKYPLFDNINGDLTVGDNFVCGRFFRLELFNDYYGQRFNPKLSIGNNVTIEDNCHIGCINEIEIGDGCLFASRVYITDHFHGNAEFRTDVMPSMRELISKGKVIIGKNVWIGEGVSIMPNVVIGDNCIIGANSVVTKSFEANQVVAGVPARVIKPII